MYVRVHIFILVAIGFQLTAKELGKMPIIRYYPN